MTKPLTGLLAVVGSTSLPLSSYAAVVIGEWSFLNGTLRRYDDYGNISYGIFGKAAGFADSDLYGGSSLNQSFKNIFGGTSGSGDENRDVYMIQTGIHNA